MASHTAEPRILAEIRRLALDPNKVRVTRTAEYDLLGRQLKKDDVCQVIVQGIDAGERVKTVTLRGADSGATAYEMKPRIGGVLFYVKVTLRELGQPQETLLVISAHVDH
jgi:hypothetical protein